MKTTHCEGLETTKISSLVGNWRIEVCFNGLHCIKLDSDVSNDNFLQKGSKEVQLLQSSTNPHVPQILQWFQAYFQNQEEPNIDLKICDKIANFKNHNFRQKVWLTLMNEVKYGQTVSYATLAKMSGHPGAFQAVGSAMSNNPISLVVPCHRVVKSDGSIGNYSKATKNDIKKWLLDHESMSTFSNE